MITVCYVEPLPYVLYGISHHYSARRWLELLQLNLQKDQYSNSLSLPICDTNPMKFWNSLSGEFSMLGNPRAKQYKSYSHIKWP